MASKALFDVQMERRRQDMKWGVQNHKDGTCSLYATDRDEWRRLCDAANKSGTIAWADILCEEVYEALAEVDIVNLRKELIEVAAVAVAWAEAIDRRQNR